jgi:hypothetical protein
MINFKGSFIFLKIGLWGAPNHYLESLLLIQILNQHKMKKLFFAPIFILGIACLISACQNAQHEKSQLVVQKAALSLDPWEVEFVEGNRLRFHNGDTFATVLYNMDYIGQLGATDSAAPFLILSGRECRECDANKFIFIHSPANGELKGNYLKQKFPYPGRELAYENGAPVNECRFFFGEILPGVQGAIWHQNTLVGKKMSPNVLLVQIKDGQLTTQVLKADKMPDLEKTLLQVENGKALELPGEEFYTEPQ